MRKNFQKIIAFSGMILFATMGMYSSIVSDSEVRIPVVKSKNAPADTVARFQQVSIISPGEIVIPNPSVKMRFLRPGEIIFFDPVYSIAIMTITIILALTFWNFSYKHPFTQHSTLGIILIAITVYCIYGFNIIYRYQWINAQIFKLTKGEYGYHFPVILNTLEFCLFFVLIRLIYIFKKGKALQKEQELTV